MESTMTHQDSSTEQGKSRPGSPMTFNILLAVIAGGIVMLILKAIGVL
jgi:hypothetical protein